jgi:hypothetical protein
MLLQDTTEPYIKVFEEELTMMLMVDISGSENFGTKTTQGEIVTGNCCNNGIFCNTK